MENPKSDPLLYKLPPQNIEMEEAVLSSVILDGSIFAEIADVVVAEDFYKTSHQKIFKAAVRLFNSGEPIDLLTLTNIMKDRKELLDAGGAAYLAKLVGTVPITPNPSFCAKVIHEKALLRKLIGNSSKIISKCYDNAGDVTEVLDYAQSCIFEVADKKSSQDFQSIGNLVIDNIDMLEERQRNKSLLTGVPTGYSYFDNLTSGLQPSDLIILAARPSMGKTAFALNIARNVAVLEGVPVAVFSLEMSKEQLSLRLLTAEARVDSSAIRSGFFGDDDWVKIQEGAGKLEQAPIFIDDTPNMSVMDIRAKARRLKLEKGLGLVVVDYIQLMSGKSSTERRDLEISEISRGLKGLAKELNIPVLALSQLNRMLEQRSDKRPMLSDLRESGALEQDADLVAFIYRDEVYNKEENNPNIGKAEIILGKQRNGPLGTTYLSFIGKYTRFENMELGDYL